MHERRRADVIALLPSQRKKINNEPRKYSNILGMVTLNHFEVHKTRLISIYVVCGLGNIYFYIINKDLESCGCRTLVIVINFVYLTFEFYNFFQQTLIELKI